MPFRGDGLEVVDFFVKALELLENSSIWGSDQAPVDGGSGGTTCQVEWTLWITGTNAWHRRRQALGRRSDADPVRPYARYMREENDELAPLPDLEPPIHARALPAEVAALRGVADAQAARVEAELQPRIDRHIAVYQEAVDALIAMHRALADDTDLELGAHTRWAAVWEMSGRCLAIGNVLLHDLRGGFASEAIGTLRALHEASQLLSALSFHEEEEVVRRWLAGEYIRPREVRDVQRRNQELALQRMAEAGIEPEGGDIVQLGREIYGLLSEGSHHQRSVMRESMAPAIRRFAYGPHPDARNRASHVDYAGELLEEVIIIVGDAFADILGRDFYVQRVRPLQEALARVWEEAPLSE